MITAPGLSQTAFVIHLKQHSRAGALVEQAREQGFAVRLVEGIDGRGVTFDLEGWKCNDDIVRWHLNRRMSGAEIGCAIGHLKAYRAASTTTSEWVVFFEDDARLTANAMANVECAVEHLRTDVPIILTLFSGAPQVVLDASTRMDLMGRSGRHLSLGRSVTPPPFALAYVMNLKARLLASRQSSVDGVADWPLWAERCEFWALTPWTVYPDQLVDSLIEDSRKLEPRAVPRRGLWSDFQRRSRVSFQQLGLKRIRLASHYFGGIAGLWTQYYRKRIRRVWLASVCFGRSSDQVVFR